VAAWIDDSAVPTVALLVVLALGAGLHAGFSAYRASHVRYSVGLAGDGFVSTHRSLVDAEDTAHRLIGNPETEHERGQAVLIIDQDGKLIDTVTQ